MGVVKFSRDARGVVTVFTANSDGARGCFRSQEKVSGAASNEPGAQFELDQI